ncbi:hypothetical protein [Nonomuraea salmonea]|uniref:hypothetical protein n=1 Tax=Nonomuraea salmonea TaxID=46181 RepID=UPI0031ECE420
MIRNVTFFSDVGVKLIVPAPVPDFSTAPLSALSSCHDPIAPVAPDASRITTRPTVVAEPHLIEMSPVEPDGDQYVLMFPSRTLP